MIQIEKKIIHNIHNITKIKFYKIYITYKIKILVEKI